MVKVLMALLVVVFLSPGTTQATSIPKVDLFDIKEGKAIQEFENSADVQTEVELWLRSISGFSDRANILEFQNGYCLRIPIYPVQVDNIWIDASIRDVFLLMDPTHKPVLLIFDVNWPRRYFVHFTHDVRPFLKKLGIWEMVKSSFPPIN